MDFASSMIWVGDVQGAVSYVTVAVSRRVPWGPTGWTRRHGWCANTGSLRALRGSSMQSAPEFSCWNSGSCWDATAVTDEVGTLHELVNSLETIAFWCQSFLGGYECWP